MKLSKLIDSVHWEMRPYRLGT